MPLDQLATACVSHPPHQDRTGPIPARCGSRQGTRWFVVRTHPLAEQQAVDGIREQGFWTYLPLIAATRRDRYVEIPLFPGYGFAAFDRDADPWGAINYTRGVMGLISSAGKPTACPPGAVEALMAGEGARRSQTPCAGILRPLEAVSVVAGPFRGHPGQVVAVNGARAVVTLMAFGGLINVHVAVADLRAGGE